METEAWEPPPDEAPSEAEPASSYVFASPLDTRKRERDADDAAGATGAAGAVRPRRRAATTSEERAWRARDEEALEFIKEQERNKWHTAAAAQAWTEGATLEASHAAFEEELGRSDLEDNCVFDPDGDYKASRARKRPRNKPPAHVRGPKRPRTGTKPAVAPEIIDPTGDSE